LITETRAATWEDEDKREITEISCNLNSNKLGHYSPVAGFYLKGVETTGCNSRELISPLLKQRYQRWVL
jgi:hypothetical protein